MTDKKKNGWIKFVPSLDLPKERVSIAYDTHDERGVRYAYGYFQFYNGTCGCFWKDGNEQPKVVKAEDIKYWMPVPSLDVQEEPISIWHDASKETPTQGSNILMIRKEEKDTNYPPIAGCFHGKSYPYDKLHWYKAKLKKIKSLADKMYNAAFNMTTDASLLRKAMDDYHQFIIYEYYKKEPASEKKCMFTKDNYTDEDRKVLCEDCKERCAYAIAGVISTNAQIKEEPVSESIDFEQELYKAFGQIKDFTLGIAIAKRFYDMGRKHNEPVNEKKCMFTKDNYTDEDRMIICEDCKEKCEYSKKEEPVNKQNLSNVQKIGKDLKELVSEDLEEAIDTYLKSYWGGEKEKQEWPFLKKMAIYFAQWKKEQMMTKAKSGTVQKDNQVILDNGTYIDLDPSMQLKPSFVGLKEGDRIKVIIIKEG